MGSAITTYGFTEDGCLQSMGIAITTYGFTEDACLQSMEAHLQYEYDALLHRDANGRHYTEYTNGTQGYVHISQIQRTGRALYKAELQ